jgi:hypothetical protein
LGVGLAGHVGAGGHLVRGAGLLGLPGKVRVLDGLLGGHAGVAHRGGDGGAAAGDLGVGLLLGGVDLRLALDAVLVGGGRFGGVEAGLAVSRQS